MADEPQATDTDPPQNPNPDPNATDPFVQSLLTNMDKVLPPETAPDDMVRPIVTLGEAIAAAKVGSSEPQAELTDDQKKAAEQKAAADAAKAQEEAAKEKAEKEKAEAEKAKPQQQKPPARVKRKLTIPAQPQAQQPQPQPKPELPTQPQADEEYIKTLSPDQQDQIAIARHAEAKGRTGVLAKAVEFFRKVDQFVDEHPEADPNGQEFQHFVETARPWNESEAKRMERDWLKDQAIDEARRSMAPEIQEQSRQLRAMQVKPIIEEAMQALYDGMTQKPEGQDMVEVDPGVIEVLTKNGYEAALAKYPVEAPIIQGSRNATQAWMEIANGVRPVYPNSAVDTWLLEFINTQCANMARSPKEQQTLKDGRTFLPMDKFISALTQDATAAQRHWTFSNEDVVDMISNQALLHINIQLKALERSGFKRDRKVSGSGQNQPTTPPTQSQPQGGSPRAGASTPLPGASDRVETEAPDEAEQFMEMLVPGITKELKASAKK